LYEPDVVSHSRKTPEFLTDLRSLKRKEKTTCCAKDLWTHEEDELFLKYCPDKRLRLYHIMARETSGRPHELLMLKIGDCIFQNTEDGRIYATVTIGKGGKTIPRTVPLINSIPFLKDWLITSHPYGESKNHFIFPSLNRRSKMRNKQLDSHSLNVLYSNMKRKLFPRLLEDANIPIEDKLIIRELLTKPFYPYLRRHAGITEKARQLPEYSLRLYSGWTKTSKMPEIYTHELGHEITNQILEVEGFSTKKQQSVIMTKQCPNCNELVNKHSNFCYKCRMILTYDEFRESVEEKENEKLRMARIEAKLQVLENEFRTKVRNIN
jgi:hypothetical protein